MLNVNEGLQLRLASEGKDITYLLRNRRHRTRQQILNPFENDGVASIHSLCLTVKDDTTNKNEQKNERQNANASAKSKELHPLAQSQHNAAHLLLPKTQIS